MIKYTKPTELNGSQLRKELQNAGITISDASESVMVDGNNDLWLDIADKDKAKAETIVAAHIGVDESAIREAAKAALLARLGITADEAKLLLA